MRWLGLAILVFTAWSAVGERLSLVRPIQYTGMADASAAVAVSSNLFLVADDEDNILRLYSSERGTAPLQQFDCNAFLETTGKSPEADLEAAARIGDRVFWIGSHGRNRNGKERTNRCRFFATDVNASGTEIEVTPVGYPYKRLLDDLFREPKLERFDLQDAALRAPKEFDSLNIEGLAATPDRHLLIGFRNPIPQRKALLVPMLNPNDVIEGSPARFGEPILLELDGLGIRDMALYQNEYLIIAGSYKEGGRFELFRWSGGNTQPKRIKVDHFNRYHPEAIIIYPAKGLREVQILSDDGTEVIGGLIQHDIPDYGKRVFRSFWLVSGAE